MPHIISDQWKLSLWRPVHPDSKPSLHIRLNARDSQKWAWGVLTGESKRFCVLSFKPLVGVWMWGAVSTVRILTKCVTGYFYFHSWELVKGQIQLSLILHATSSYDYPKVLFDVRFIRKLCVYLSFCVALSQSVIISAWMFALHGV